MRESKIINEECWTYVWPFSLSSDANFLSFAAANERSPCNFCKQNYLQYDHEQFLLKAYESIFLEGNVPKKWLGNHKDWWKNERFSSWKTHLKLHYPDTFVTPDTYLKLGKNVLCSCNFALKSSIYKIFPWMTENV